MTTNEGFVATLTHDERNEPCPDCGSHNTILEDESVEQDDNGDRWLAMSYRCNACGGDFVIQDGDKSPGTPSDWGYR